MFLINSRYRLVFATGNSSESKSHHHLQHTFLRTYGVNLQSSLTRVFSSALGYSPHLPVSVLGTITHTTCYVAFLGSMESVTSAHKGTYSSLGLNVIADLPTPHPTLLNQHIHQLDHLSFSVPTSLKRNVSGTGILTCFPSTTPFGLALGID